jgi:hypothetical protein
LKIYFGILNAHKSIIRFYIAIWIYGKYWLWGGQGKKHIGLKFIIIYNYSLLSPFTALG